MNKTELKQKWVDALKSGEYEQGTDRLGDTKLGMCCMGVANYLLFNMKDNPEDQYLNSVNNDLLDLDVYLTTNEIGELGEYANNLGQDGLETQYVRRYEALATLNDRLGLSFVQIAQIIENFGWDR